MFRTAWFAMLMITACVAFAGNCAAEECHKLMIASGALPRGTVGEAYQHRVPMFGGKRPVSVILREGQLPGGLSFTPDGFISGTPVEPGYFRISFFASDSCPQHQDAFQTLQLLVGEKGKPLEFDASVIVKERLSVAIATVPSVAELPRGKYAADIVYQVTANPRETAILHSYGLSFQVNGLVVQNVQLPLSAVLINGVTTVRETVTLPKAVIEAAQREKEPKITMSRAFMGRGTTALGMLSFALLP